VTLADLEGEALPHRYGDFFAPPGLTNWIGVGQVDNDPVSVRSITFPPFSTGDAITALAYIGGRLASSYGGDVVFTWRPDRVVRETDLGALHLRTTTVMVPDTMALVVDLELTNTGDSEAEVPVRLVFDSRITQALRPWGNAEQPAEYDNAAAGDPDRAAVVFTAAQSEAVCIQGLDRDATVSGNVLSLSATIAAGETWRVGYVLAVGPDAAAAGATFDTVAADVPGTIEATARRWQDELDAMFTVGNDRFGGSLPVLDTTNDALRRIYYMGALGVLYFRRDSPYSVIGRSYDTLMPRYWATVTFLWDYYLSTRVHVLLDPSVMRTHLEHWIATDTHTHFGTEWLTGATVGNWYSVNDLAMTRMITEYAAWTGDESWLDTKVEADASGKTVVEHLDRFATAYRELLKPHGLADYGGIDNLLECVSSYLHAVASFNAGNVWNLRAAADVHERRGDLEGAELLRKEAAELAARVNELYVDGGGYFKARYPDGSEVPVKHCLDFFQVPFAMLSDLSQQQRDEMTDYFVRELHTPLWMHALSPEDPDAVFSVRPDHQWNGAYPAWPPEAAKALFRMGRDDVAAPWLEGLAASSNQGPWAQAQFAEDACPPDGRGARKAPPEFPWITDWTCSSNGAWVGLVIDAIFGVTVAADGTVSADPRLALVDPDARLRNLVVRGVSYDVDAAGVRPTEA
jgi:hypothetical protein